MVGHLSYFLLVISMLTRVMWVLRVLVIISALVGITYDVFWTKDPVGVFWETSLVVVNFAQLMLSYLQNRKEKFTHYESTFVDSAFPGLAIHSNAEKSRQVSGSQYLRAPVPETLVKNGPNLGGSTGARSNRRKIHKRRGPWWIRE